MVKSGLITIQDPHFGKLNWELPASIKEIFQAVQGQYGDREGKETINVIHQEATRLLDS